jgi:hypothetical protein
MVWGVAAKYGGDFIMPEEITPDNWDKVSKDYIDRCEDSTRRMMRIHNLAKSSPSTPPETLTTIRKMISDNLELIKAIKTIDTEVQNAKKTVGGSPETPV